VSFGRTDYGVEYHACEETHDETTDVGEIVDEWDEADCDTDCEFD
jgi:hypothetical protein